MTVTASEAARALFLLYQGKTDDQIALLLNAERAFGAYRLTAEDVREARQAEARRVRMERS